MPNSAQQVTVSRTDFTPARWPAIRGNPRARAHRPLPSMMIATCRGRRPGSRSNGGDFLLFAGEELIEFGDVGVGEFLDRGRVALELVLGQRLVVLGGLQLVVRLLPDVADGDLPFLAGLLRDLHELLPALLRERRDVEPDRVALPLRGELQVRRRDGLLDGLERVLVPGPDLDGLGVRGA